MEYKNKKRMLLVLCCLLLMLLTACRDDDMDDDFDDDYEEEVRINEVATNDNNTLSISDEYNILLRETTDVESIYQYIEDHIRSCTPQEAEIMLRGLYGYLNNVSEVDYDRLAEFYDALPPDVQAFITIMKTEEETPALVDGDIKIPLEDLLLRCEILEEHMDRFENEVSYTHARDLYYNYLVAAITGGYDEVNHKENVYMSEDKKHIDETAYDTYADFAFYHEDTETGEIVERYVRVLDRNKKVINDDVIQFYQDIYETINNELD